MDLRAYIETQRVRRIGYRPALSVKPDTPIGDAVELMRERAVGCLLVVEGEVLRGIFTERDLLRKVLVANAQWTLADPISDVMTADPVVAHADEALAVLLDRMYSGGFRHIPLLESGDRLLGTISLKRVIGFLADQFAAAVYNLPPQPENFGSAREGA